MTLNWPSIQTTKKVSNLFDTGMVWYKHQHFQKKIVIIITSYLEEQSWPSQKTKVALSVPFDFGMSQVYDKNWFYKLANEG